VDLPDNNVLIYCFRPEMEQHARAKAWLEESLNRNRAVRLFPTVEVGFVRLMTRKNLFKPPSIFSEVRGFLTTLSSAPSVEVASWNTAARNRWLQLCEDLDLTGNDCNDAMLAALAIEKGFRLVTFDKGFRRFRNLQLLLLSE